MHCPGCGARNENDARFCTTCGQKIEFGIGDLSSKEPGSSLADFERLQKRPGKGLSVTSLVLGLLAVLPFGWFAGIPAIVLGALALVKKRPGRSMALAGLVLGAVAPIVSTLVFFAVLPGVVHSRERSRQAAVKQAMTVVQEAFDAYAADYGSYPGEKDWSFAGGRARLYLPGAVVSGAEDINDPVVGTLPENPYSGAEYTYGDDFFYFPAQLDSHQTAITSEDDDLCPYSGYEAPGEKPGTIVVFGHTDDSFREPLVDEYGIFGYGRDTDNPLGETVTDGGVEYHVLVGRVADAAPDSEPAPEAE